MAVLEVASYVPVTTAEGPGRRFAVWVQGCSLRCPGCCNPRLFTPGRGASTPVDALLTTVDQARRDHDLEGLTVLGGEPLEQLDAMTALCRGAARQGLGVLVFSGYQLAEARQLSGFDDLWGAVDTLVDGRFDATRPEPSPEHGGRRFIGSHNQALQHRTDRYRDPALWRGPPRIEVQLDEVGGFSAHGEPGAIGDLLRSLEVISEDSPQPRLPIVCDPAQ